MAKSSDFVKVLPFIGIAIGSGFLIWAIIDAKSAGAAYRKGRKVIEDTTGARLSRPDMAVRGPTNTEEFEVLAEAMEIAIAEMCAESEKRGMPPLMATSAGFADEVTRRTLASLYPEFPWPAITGDHASTLELQGLLRYLVLSGDREAMCGTAGEPDEADGVVDPMPDEDLAGEFDIVPAPEEQIDALEDELGMDEGYLVYRPYETSVEETDEDIEPAPMA